MNDIELRIPIGHSALLELEYSFTGFSITPHLAIKRSLVPRFNPSPASEFVITGEHVT